MHKRAAAFYPLLRGNHSLKTYEHIKARCSAYVEVYSDFKALYLRPVKLMAGTEAQPLPLSREELEQLLTPHIFDAQKGVFLPITDGVLESRFRKAVNTELRRGSRTQVRPSIYPILPYQMPSFLQDATYQSVYDLSMICLENAKRLFEVLETLYEELHSRRLTLGRLGEVIDDPGCPETAADASEEAVSALMAREITRLKRFYVRRV